MEGWDPLGTLSQGPRLTSKLLPKAGGLGNLTRYAQPCLNLERSCLSRLGEEKIKLTSTILMNHSDANGGGVYLDFINRIWGSVNLVSTGLLRWISWVSYG